jgi:phosphatidylglycerol:prolipoprotein diacylglycerol transferase
VEIFREPDQQVGYLFGLLTMGQLLSGVMVGGGLLIWKLRLNHTNSTG